MSSRASRAVRAASSKVPAIVTDYAERAKKMALKAGDRALSALWRLIRKTGTLLWAVLKDPRIVTTWYSDIKDAVVHFGHWVMTGFQSFGANCRASFYLTKRIVQGYPLTVRERHLLVRTTSDCLKLIPFSFFIIVPFAELALPFFLRLFPSMLPSTFFEQKYDNATLARKLKAKTEMAEFWQQVVLQRTKELSEGDHDTADKVKELQEFQEKLMEGKQFPSLAEILRFNKFFSEDLNLKNMSGDQLSAMSRMLGLHQTRDWWTGHLEVQLRHHITSLRREDRDYLWEGIDSLTTPELIEACRKRAIRFHEVTEAEMRRDLTRWLELSANHRNISTVLLLWIQSFYLRAPGGHLPDHQELAIKVEPQPEAVSEAKEAFQGIAERQKAHLENAREKLESLRNEIDEILDGQKKAAAALEEGTDAAEEPPTAPVPEQASESSVPDKRSAMQRLGELEKELYVYKEVVQRQKSLLDQQLRFLATMRDNKPVQNKDADVILLDQRIRLLEMIVAFEKSLKEIETVLNEEEPQPVAMAPPSAVPELLMEAPVIPALNEKPAEVASAQP